MTLALDSVRLDPRKKEPRNKTTVSLHRMTELVTDKNCRGRSNFSRLFHSFTFILDFIDLHVGCESTELRGRGATQMTPRFKSGRYSSICLATFVDNVTKQVQLGNAHLKSTEILVTQCFFKT